MVWIARLLPYTLYAAAAATAMILCWDTAHKAWLFLAAISFLALVAVQVSPDLVAAADAHADPDSARQALGNMRWTIPIAILCALPVPILGACLILGGGSFIAACLVIGSPVLARILHDRYRRTGTGLNPQDLPR